jgi:predicted nucleic acid-binding Zn ribbon protein
MKRRRRAPQAIGGVVEQVLDDLGLEVAMAALRIGEVWEEAVGKEIASHCWPVAVRGRVLEAEVDSSVWCQQLQMERVELLAALQEALGADAPTDLRLRVGYSKSRQR